MTSPATQTSPATPHLDLFRLQQEQQAQLKWLHDVSRRTAQPCEDFVRLHGAIRGLRGDVVRSAKAREVPNFLLEDDALLTSFTTERLAVKVLFVEPGEGSWMLRCKSVVHRTNAASAVGDDAEVVRVEKSIFEAELSRPESIDELGGDLVIVVSTGEAFLGQCVLGLEELFPASVDVAPRRKALDDRDIHVRHKEGWFPLSTRSGEALDEDAEVHLRISAYVPMAAYRLASIMEANKRRERKSKTAAARASRRTVLRQAKSQTSKEPRRRRPKEQPVDKARTVEPVIPEKNEDKLVEASVKKAADTAARLQREEALRSVKLDMANRIKKYEELRDRELEETRKMHALQAAVLELELREKRIDAGIEASSKQLERMLKEEQEMDKLDNRVGRTQALLEEPSEDASITKGSPELEEAYTLLKTKHMQIVENIAEHEKNIKAADEDYRATCERIRQGCMQQRKMFSDQGEPDDTRRSEIREECIKLRAQIMQVSLEEERGLSVWQELEQEALSLEAELGKHQDTLSEKLVELQNVRFEADSARERCLEMVEDDLESSLRIHQDRLRHLLNLASDESWGG